MGNERRYKIQNRDYSLVGRNSVLAKEKGLADAKWYAPYVPKEKMRKFLERRNDYAIRDTLLWFLLLLGTGLGGYLLWGSWWAIIPFALYGVLYASVSDSRWHESSHGTAFKSDWMNNVLYEMASFMVLRESIPWRWSHIRHHSDTLIVGLDPEISAQRPINLLRLILNFFNVNAMINYVRTVFMHSFGKLTADERTYIPESEYKSVFERARIYFLIYAGVFGLTILTDSILPLMYVGLSSFYGAWLMVIYGLSQHSGLAENVLDHRLNSRTIYMNAIHRYLYWNMNYHVEHHIFPLVPYHALPKLHEHIKKNLPVPYDGLIEAYKEIIPTLLRQAHDAEFYIKRTLPDNATKIVTEDSEKPIDETQLIEREGWLEICDTKMLKKEDILRFDYENKTYALYRTQENQVYATDGLCTHGNAHLADGLLKGNQIECAKHNGRFDVRDGSPQRMPVCIGLKTYPVRERNGRLQVDLLSASGYGISHAAETHRFRVVSNHNVATFIKELVLEGVDGAVPLKYQPGDYMQLDIPTYAERSLENIIIDKAFLHTWQALGIFELLAANLSPIRRNYSIASNPYKDKTISFNIRLATPPNGVSCYAGIASSYLFGLKAGDLVTAIGPFGEFHVKESMQEMVYLGGGAGMAPLRSHISYLLETLGIKTRISYWYGVRSLKEVFYQDYFNELENKFENFSFHLALSEPLPEDDWSSYTGFIHEILHQAYLSQHQNPKEIAYFLCGPPAMIKAARVMLDQMGVNPKHINFDEF